MGMMNEGVGAVGSLDEEFYMNYSKYIFATPCRDVS